MQRSLLKDLVCPYTKEKLILSNEKIDSSGEIISGILTSVKTQNKYQIKNYIPVMLKSFKTQKKFKDWEEEWLDKDFEYNTSEGDTGASKKLFASDYKLKSFNFKKNTILEAGCGSGRITKLIYENDIEKYFCVDISDAIFEARRKHKNLKNIYFVKCDISRLPFKEDFFDKIFLIGVLQHTKNPPKTVEELSTRLKIGGYLYGGMYMLPENFFIRQRFFLTEMIRKFFKVFRISRKIRKYFTWFSVPAYRYSVLRPLQWLFFNNSLPNNISNKYIWLINYDYYNPNIYQHVKTREYTKKIFLQSGLVPICATKSSENGYVFEKKI